ncbi:hypothetical protein ABZ369_21745, partial [Streptomyces sp. NPDC005918]
MPVTSVPETSVPVTHLLSGLAANPSLPPDLVDRLIAFAVREPDGGDVAAELAGRADLGRARAAALVSGAEESVVRAGSVGWWVVQRCVRLWRRWV